MSRIFLGIAIALCATTAQAASAYGSVTLTRQPTTTQQSTQPIQPVKPAGPKIQIFQSRSLAATEYKKPLSPATRQRIANQAQDSQNDSRDRQDQEKKEIQKILDRLHGMDRNF
jgi:hypothetical protein